MLKLFKNGKGKSDNGWLIIAVIAAALLVPQSPFYLGTLFPGFSMSESSLTLPDGKNIPVFYSSLDGIGIASNTVSVVSKATTTDSRVVRITLVPNLKGVEKVGIRGRAAVDGGTGNFPANAALFIIIENTNGNNAVELLRTGRHDGTKISSMFGGDAPGGVKDGFSLVDSNSQASLGNIEYDIPQAYRTSQYRLIVEMHVSSKVKDYYDRTWTTGRVTYRFDGLDITIATEQLCETTGGNYSFSTSSCACPPPNLGFDSVKGCIADTSCKVGETKLADGTCKASCKADEVELISGACKKLIRTCVDNNENGVCDPSEPVIYADPDSLAPVCSDRDNNKVCDDVQSLFCQDSNGNQICDSDELKWFATYCEDKNSNAICDNLESGNILCPTTYAPVCTGDNVTFPNACLASGFGYTTANITQGACPTRPIIIRLDCATGAVPIPTGYTCDYENGWLIRTDKIYVNTTIDCRTLPPVQDYACTNLGNNQWVYTRTQFIGIDCYSKGCPEGSLCQGGLCTKEITKRCPTEVNCEQTYGSGTTCSESVGLCVKTQYLTQDCSILGCSSGNKCVAQTGGNVCVKTEQINATTVFDKNTIFGKPRGISTTALVIIGAIVIGGILLAARKP